MNNLVTMINGEATVTSRQVAENFGRDHSKIHRSIEGILEELGNAKSGETSMFSRTIYIDQWNRSQTEYIMNRDGWTLLTMGFTGAKALQWKLKYIAAFNEMEKQLSKPQELTRMQILEMALESEKS